MALALVVPVLRNFEGFTKLMASIDTSIFPIVVPNWENNMGVSRSWNYGIKKAHQKGYDRALVCNDDVVLHPKTIQKLGWALGTFDLVTAINTRDEPITTSTEFSQEPDFSCFLVNTAAFIHGGKFGQFDENFSPAYFEDNDMGYRIKLMNGKAVKCLNAGMYHVGSVTQNWDGQQVVTAPMFIKNRTYYINKWGGMPGSEIYKVPFNNPDLGINDWF
jgi:GT2 family glycosyltransferase